MYLYSKDYDAKKARDHKDNADAYVVVDKGSAAEAAYLGQGYTANDEYDAKADAKVSGEEADLLAEATEAAEQKLQAEHAQRVAAEAKAIAGGGMPVQPNDQSRETPNTESADGKTVKEAVGAKEVGADSKAAVVETKAADAKAAEPAKK